MDADSVLTDYKNGDFSIRAEAQSKIKEAIPDFNPLSTQNVGLTYKLEK